MRDLIRLISKNSDDYDKKCMKIKFNSDDELPLTSKSNDRNPSSDKNVIVVFHENNKYFPQVFLDKCLYKL